MAANKDLDPPWTESVDSETYQFGTVAINSFKSPDRLPIFWGPGQLTSAYPDYMPPDVEAWRKYEILNIPQVVRFIHNSDEAYDTDKYRNSTSPPPPPPDPRTCTFHYDLAPSYFHRIPASALTPEGDPIYEYYRYKDNGDGTTSKIPANLMIGDSPLIVGLGTTVLYDGTVAEAPPAYLSHIPFRTISWLRTCSGGGLPITTTLVGVIAASMPVGSDPSAAPRCWVLSDDGSWFSEVVSEAFSQYGCSSVHP